MCRGTKGRRSAPRVAADGYQGVDGTLGGIPIRSAISAAQDRERSLQLNDVAVERVPAA